MSVIDDFHSDTLFGDPENFDGDEVDRPLFVENEADEPDDNAEENDYVAQTRPQSDNSVQPKLKKVVKNPQPKLNPERLKGHRGLAILENVFKDYRFCGKGYEKRDVDQVMKRLEHWAHRLFPKYQFDDCLEKIESLGYKKIVTVYVKKIRMGLETIESPVVEPAAEVNEEDDLALPLDPFDELLSQQLSEPLPSQTVAESQQNYIPSSPPRPKIILTEEQRERMERNRRIAQERRLARIKALQEKESQVVPVLNVSRVLETDGEENNEIKDCQKVIVVESTEMTYQEDNEHQETCEEVEDSGIKITD